jgi:hypothetical protein
MWATRCMHEARTHEDAMFITLTYDEAHLPRCGGLQKSHLTNFMKKLRQDAKRRFDIDKIKFLACGEYGEQFKRPHYHALIFGYDMLDKKVYTRDDDGTLYSSERMDEIWNKGDTKIGAVTWKSAAYVARYSLKKITGAKAEEIDPITGLKPYERIHLDTMQIVEVEPEYITMSRRPGLGSVHFDKYHTDFYPSDECVVNGHPTRPPRYYDKKYEEIDPQGMESIKQKRIETMHKYAHENTRSRLAVRKKVKEAQTQSLKRKL